MPPFFCGSGSCMSNVISEGCPQLEIYNSCFTSNYGKWALGFCGGIYGKENPGCNDQSAIPFQSLTSLDLSNRQIHNLINKVQSCCLTFSRTINGPILTGPASKRSLHIIHQANSLFNLFLQSFVQGFSPAEFPCLSYLNLHGNPLDENSVYDLLELLRGFSSLLALEVDIPGPLGDSAVEILDSLPGLGVMNGVDVSKILESGKSVVDSMLQPRLPEWTAGEPLLDRVINAMWLYLMTYRLADEEKIDETSVWYVRHSLPSLLQGYSGIEFDLAGLRFIHYNVETNSCPYVQLY